MRDLVHFVVEEIVVGIKVLILEHPLADHFVGHLSFHVHHKLEHFVVGRSREENLARVKLVNGTAHRPGVYSVIVPHADDCKPNRHTKYKCKHADQARLL